MLFESQREELMGTKHTMYLAAAALIKDGAVAFVTGVRTKTEPYVIIANVDYINEDGTTKQAFNQSMSPADFERFLNTFAMKVATISKGSTKLVELSHHFKPLDDNKFMDLSDEGKNAALRAFLLQLVTGNSQKDASAAAGSIIKAYLKQHS